MSIIKEISLYTQGLQTYLKVELTESVEIPSTASIVSGEKEEVYNLYFKAPDLNMNLDLINKMLVELKTKFNEAGMKMMHLIKTDAIENTSQTTDELTVESWMTTMLQQSCNLVTEDYIKLINVVWNTISKNAYTDNYIAQPSNHLPIIFNEQTWCKEEKTWIIYNELCARIPKEYLVFFAKRLKVVPILMNQ